MNFRSLKTVLITNVFLCIVQTYSVPIASKKCSLKDSQCLVETIKEGISNLRNGNSEVNTLPLEPLEIPSLTIGGHGSVDIEQKYKNVKIYGLTTGDVTKADFDEATNTLRFTVLSPKVKFKADYEFNGKILLLPIVGKGPAELTFSDLEIQITLTMEEVDKKGKKHFKPINFDIALNTRKAYFDLQNLFDGNKRIADPVLATLNDNWETIFNDIKNGYERGLAPALFNYAKRVFAKKSYEELFE